MKCQSRLVLAIFSCSIAILFWSFNQLYHVRLNTYTLAEGRQKALMLRAEGREESLK
ncbi:MAG: hypothetical protein F6K39_37395 [Okeania sp. SIO3B3]|nr:hypothetical protein [Okeania sp. SIO3B3]